MYGLKILLGHLVGDYIFQNDWVARNKKQSSWICLLHVAIYCCVIWGFTFWPLWAIGIIGVCHFAQDRTNLVPWYMDNVSGQKEFRTGPCHPWAQIMVDNIFHLIQLFAVAQIVP